MADAGEALSASAVFSEVVKFVTGALVLGAWKVWSSIRDLGAWRKSVDEKLTASGDYALAREVEERIAEESAARVSACDGCRVERTKAEAECKARHEALAEKVRLLERQADRMQGRMDADRHGTPVDGAPITDRGSHA